MKSNAGASLLDLGEGVLAVEFHSKMNAIGGDTMEMLEAAVTAASSGYLGLVIGTQGQHFSAGANLMLLLLAGFWIIQTGLLAGLEFTEQKVEVVAYLHQNATESQINALAAEIEQRPDVESVEIVTRDKALDRFRGERR